MLEEQLCPCGSQKNFAKCCEPLLKGEKRAPTAEALMRSRYAAFVVADIPYLIDTAAPETRDEFDEKATRHWATQSEWLGFDLIETKKGRAGDKEGSVEFVAHFILDGQEHRHHELAEFRYDELEERWYFVDGAPPKIEPIRREAEKVGRNDPCPCGSGEKYKRCHGAA